MMLIAATFSGPVLCASPPAIGAIKIIGMPNTLMVNPMKTWLAPRSDRKTAHIDSKTPMVTQKEMPSARQDCMAGFASSSLTIPAEGGAVAAGMFNRSAPGENMIINAVSTTNVAGNPEKEFNIAAITGPIRKPAVS